MTRKYTADGLEDDLNHDPLYQAGVKHLKDLADRAGNIVEGHFVTRDQAANQAADDAEAVDDMKYLSYVEGYLDGGGQITQEIYNRCDEIERRNRRKQGF